MREEVALCDLCYQDGNIVLAVAEYQNDEGETFCACKKHLEDVETLGLSYRRFEVLGDLNI